MFGFNKKKPMIEGPIEFEAEVEIDRPASEVFPLIDITDPRFRQRQFGAEVKAEDGSDNRFIMTVETFDDAVFHFEVLEHVEGQRQKCRAKMVPQLFALVQSIEDYTIEPRGENACCLKLVTSAEFDPELSVEEVAEEVTMMSLAVNGDLAKGKVFAEEGLEAAKAMEEAMNGLEFDFDLGEIDIEWDDIEPEQ